MCVCVCVCVCVFLPKAAYVYYVGSNGSILYGNSLTLHLTCQFWALQIQQQIKIRRQKYGQMGIKLSDWVKNIVGKFLLFPQCFRKLYVVDTSK